MNYFEFQKFGLGFQTNRRARHTKLLCETLQKTTAHRSFWRTDSTTRACMRRWLREARLRLMERHQLLAK